MGDSVRLLWQYLKEELKWSRQEITSTVKRKKFQDLNAASDSYYVKHGRDGSYMKEKLHKDITDVM